jgi:sugar-specific transcriptional regulator TrmB
MNINFLEEAGLTRTEAKVYLSILDLGSSLAGKITRKSGIHRRTVYDAIERLIQKGLISYIVKNNRHYFEAVDPKRFLALLTEKEKNIQTILPELELKYNLTKEKEETLFFKGKQAMKNIFDDQIKEEKEICIFGAASNAADIIKYYFPRYDNARKSRGIRLKAIFNEKVKYKIPLSQIRYLPKKYSAHTATNIYGDKVAIILWTEEPFAILIKNKNIAKSYKQYFNLMWKVAKP